MTNVSQEILDTYQIRKGRKRKNEFIEFLSSKFPELKVEQSGKTIVSKNLILGDIEKADTIISAHYDTPAVMPFPNFIAPFNLFLTLIYSVLIVIPMFVIMFGLSFFLAKLNLPFYLILIISYAVLFVFFYLLMAGKANKHNANDNTSGIILLIEMYNAMTDIQKQKTALVFFDNEELGLIGSRAFLKSYKKIMKDKLLINADCIGVGDHLGVIQTPSVIEKQGDKVEKAFSNSTLNIILKSSKKAMYPSDQAGFPNSIALACLTQKKGFGFYLSNIHTKKDTKLEFKNIDDIKSCLLELI